MILRALFAGLATVFAATWPTSTGAHPERGEIELTVVGPPVDPAETGHDYIYLEPSVPDGLEANTSSAGILSQGWSMLGREDKAAAIDDEYQSSACPALDPPVIGEAAVLERIVEAAQDHRVVIINESHSVTRHRDFSRKVIASLRPLGYKVFAAETFSNRQSGETDPVDTYADLPYVERRLGYYSNEPVFGAMLRDAKALGYRFAAYEQVYDPNRQRPNDARVEIRDREIEQAANLAALINTLEPDEKLIVHVGYAHAREANVVGKDGWDHSWMAARLKRDHGIDPLTIAQTICRGSNQQVSLGPIPPDMDGWFDMSVDHPPVAFRFGRPEWRFDDGYQPAAIPEELKPVDSPLIIEAFANGEPFDAVPVDRVWVEPGEEIMLALRPGRYNVRAVRPVILPAAD